MGTTVPLQIKLNSQLLMVSIRNMSRSHANPLGTQDQQGDLDSRPPRDALETLQVNTDEVEALRLTNQRLLRDLGRQYHDAPWDANEEGETSQAKEHYPYKPPGEDHN